MISTLVGTHVGAAPTGQLLLAIVWVHPVVLAVLWAHEIVLCTRWPAGEIDRGTIDVLLGLPVLRRAVYWSESITWGFSGVFVLAMAALGYALGARAIEPADRPGTGPVLLVLINLLCVYAATGGFAFLISSMSSRRGRAVSIVFGVVLASFLLNFVSQFWAPAGKLSFLCILSYYQPARILDEGALLTGDVAVLLAVAALTWVLGQEIGAAQCVHGVGSYFAYFGW